MLAFHNARRNHAYPFFIDHFADGDTVTGTVICGNCPTGHYIRVRLHDIDSYELDSPQKTTAQTFAKELTTKFFSASGELYLSQVNSDRHGRAVGDIFIDNAFLSQILVTEGFAWHVT